MGGFITGRVMNGLFFLLQHCSWLPSIPLSHCEGGEWGWIGWVTNSSFSALTCFFFFFAFLSADFFRLLFFLANSTLVILLCRLNIRCCHQAWLLG